MSAAAVFIYEYYAIMSNTHIILWLIWAVKEIREESSTPARGLRLALGVGASITPLRIPVERRDDKKSIALASAHTILDAGLPRGIRPPSADSKEGFCRYLRLLS